VGKELTLLRELLSVETHFTDRVTVCRNSISGGSYCLWKLTLLRELLSVGTQFPEVDILCGNSLYRGNYYLWKATHFTEGPSLSVGTRFKDGVTVSGKELTSQRDRL